MYMVHVKPTYFFYDLETSGLDPRRQRIMQFAGMRTGADLNPIGEPVNILIKLADDVLPDPGAVMVTGITPQQTQADGYTEAEFLRLLADEVFKPGTIVTGFNNIRFDDEYLRYTLYRNFYDPYEWAYGEGRSRWDLMDVTRLVRALRPDGIEWPVVDGKPVNKLELIAAANGLVHTKAHDALSDVEALIGVAKLIKEKQPKMYDYLLKMRDKGEVKRLVNLESPQPFIYSSGRYDPAYLRTTAAYPVAEGSRPGSVVVFDLRYDPASMVSLSAKEIRDRQFTAKAEQDDPQDRLPIKELVYNKVPAVAPLGVLDEASAERLSLSVDAMTRHMQILRAHPHFGENIAEAYQSRPSWPKAEDVEAQLYDGFFSDADKDKMSAVRAASANELADFHPKFKDPRLETLLLRYKARNFPGCLADDEREAYEAYRVQRLQNDLPGFVRQLQTAAKRFEGDESKQFLLQELQLWAESVSPLD